MNLSFTPDECGRITKMKLNRMELTENGTSVLTDSISGLKRSVSKKINEKNSSFDTLAKLIEQKRNS